RISGLRCEMGVRPRFFRQPAQVAEKPRSDSPFRTTVLGESAAYIAKWVSDPVFSAHPRRLRKNRGQTAHFARPFLENQRLTLRNGCQTPFFPPTRAGCGKTEVRQPISHDRSRRIRGLHCEMGVRPRFFRPPAQVAEKPRSDSPFRTTVLRESAAYVAKWVSDPVFSAHPRRLRKNRGQTAHFARPFLENQRLTLRNGCQTPVFPQPVVLPPMLA